MKVRGSSIRSLLLVAPLAILPLACSLMVESALSDKPLGTGGAGGAGGTGGVGAAGSGGAPMCAGGCDAPLTCCADSCVDLSSSAANCSACGNACATGEVCCGAQGCAECCNNADCPTADHVCTANKCVLDCTPPAQECGDECAVLLTSTRHCGVCGNDCLAGHPCMGGMCTSGWATMTQTGALSARQRAAAAWTGSKLFIWGGQDALGALGDGALYDPSTDAWSMVSTDNAPTNRTEAAAVTVGTRVFVWGGGPATDASALPSGALYDPAANTWTNANDALIARRQAVALSTGDRVLIWGGMSAGSPLAGGALYDPVANSWKPMANANAPTARSNVAFAWSTTTNELLLFGGRPNGSGSTNEGYAYSVTNDAWRKLPVLGAPSQRYDAFALWVGDKMLVVGGRDGNTVYDDATFYDPATDTWSTVAGQNSMGKRSATFGRTGWVGFSSTTAFFCGGIDSAQKLKIDGQLFDHAADQWGVTSPPFPSMVDHEYGVGVWTGAEMILWSGLENNTLSAAGERYRP